MATVVLVHGMGHQNGSAAELRTAWLPSLAAGVRAAGYDELAGRIWREDRAGGVDCQMAFYGDLFGVPGHQGVSADESTGVEARLAEELALEWLTRTVEQASREVDRELAAVELAALAGETAQVQGPRSAVRAALAALARIRFFGQLGMAFAERILVRDLAQVTRYLTDSGVRMAALDRVASLIGPGTAVLIGHSLGSVVAYEAAHRVRAPLPLLVTLGSPLGLRTVVYDRVRPPPAFPPNVRYWLNVADRDDIVAAAPDLTHRFGRLPPGAHFRGGYTVDNGAHPHNANFYLAQAEVGRAVAAALMLIPPRTR